jgi:hypothetical protein
MFLGFFHEISQPWQWKQVEESLEVIHRGTSFPAEGSASNVVKGKASVIIVAATEIPCLVVNSQRDYDLGLSLAIAFEAR